MSHLTSARTYDPFKLGIRVYGFPAVMVLIGLVPVANALAYSGHGGPAWLALPLTFPYVLSSGRQCYCRRVSWCYYFDE